MREAKWLVLLAGVLFVGIAGASAALYDTHSLNADMDCSQVQMNDWSCGWTSNLSDFTLSSEFVDTGWGNLWNTASQGAPHLWYQKDNSGGVGTPVGMNGFCPPTGVADAQYSVYRWTAPSDVAAQIDITGFTTPAGMAVDHTRTVVIALNGTILWSQVITTAQADFTGLTGIAIQAGDVINFAVNRYDDSEDAGSDWTNISAVITEVPEPTTMGLLALGGMSMILRKKR